MERVLRALLFALFGVASSVQALGAGADEDAVRGLPQRFRDAWMRHDGHELAKIMADDVDFVTVGAL